MNRTPALTVIASALALLIMLAHPVVVASPLDAPTRMHEAIRDSSKCSPGSGLLAQSPGCCQRDGGVCGCRNGKLQCCNGRPADCPCRTDTHVHEADFREMF